MLRTMNHDYTEQWARVPQELKQRLSMDPDRFLNTDEAHALAQAGIAITTSVRFLDVPEPNTALLAPRDFRAWVKAQTDATTN